MMDKVMNATVKCKEIEEGMAEEEENTRLISVGWAIPQCRHVGR